MGPTLSVVLSLALTSGTAVRGAVLAFLYGFGLGIPFIIVAFALQRGMTAFQFARRHAQLIARIGGGLLVLVGILEVSGAGTSALAWLKMHWVGPISAPSDPAAAPLERDRAHPETSVASMAGVTDVGSPWAGRFRYLTIGAGPAAPIVRSRTTNVTVPGTPTGAARPPGPGRRGHGGKGPTARSLSSIQRKWPSTTATVSAAPGGRRTRAAPDAAGPDGDRDQASPRSTATTTGRRRRGGRYHSDPATSAAIGLTLPAGYSRGAAVAGAAWTGGRPCPAGGGRAGLEGLHGQPHRGLQLDIPALGPVVG